MIEGFKYQSLSIYKIKINGYKEPVIPVRELDAIYQAIAGKRCFQPFGIHKIPEEVEEEQMDELQSQETDKPDGMYHWQGLDWEHRSLPGVLLTGFIPNKDMLTNYEKLLKNAHYTDST